MGLLHLLEYPILAQAAQHPLEAYQTTLQVNHLLHLEWGEPRCLARGCPAVASLQLVQGAQTFPPLGLVLVGLLLQQLLQLCLRQSVLDQDIPAQHKDQDHHMVTLKI